ncbi:hypothetical protein ACNPKZ_18920 [Shewanella algae]|uniref:hypothetical protein n=1 Tax=Shewanella algae TaxID=38313 RepID=UPI003AAF0538
MGISKPSQGWAKHQKDMAVLYLLCVFVVFVGISKPSQAWPKHQKDMAVLYLWSNCSSGLSEALAVTNIQDILNTFRATRKHIIRSQLFINDDEILEVDSLRRLICVLHTKTAIARQANGRLKPVAAKSPRV